MQVDPRAATIVVNTPAGAELALAPGRQVTARVVEVGSDGAARISLAGQTLSVQSDAQLRAGDQIQLTVARADATGVRLSVVAPGESRSGPGAGSDGSAGRGSSLVAELARAGVPVTPQLARAAAAAAAEAGSGSTAARAVANLAGRDLSLSAVAAGRVAAALELAGSLGPALGALASRSGEIAAALPGGTPTAAALRGLLAPNLSNVELAVARIAQAAAASAAPASTAPVSLPPGSSPAVIQNYVASQVAVAAGLDLLAAQNTVLGAQPQLAARAQLAGAGGGPSAAGLALAAQQGALRGETAPPQLRAVAAAAPDAAALASAASQARAVATAAAATGAAFAPSLPTSLPVAQAVADLATLAARLAPVLAPGAGAVGDAASAAARGQNAVDVAHRSGPAGSAGAAAASVAGSGAAGDPAPLVAALRQFLASPGSEQDAARLLRALSAADPALLASVIRTLPETATLQLAGRVLDMLARAQLPPQALAELRGEIQRALDGLGRGLLPAPGGELASLRAALENVAANDPRAGVSSEAARLLAAADGQQILSRAAAGADPGYVYFQIPLPDGRGAEVMVRREPGRRQVTFDEFDIAFLLTTERLGTLMIHLDAHPGGVRADVRTDLADVEPFLRAQAEALLEPLGREARRPVTVTTGVFDAEPPQSLLEPQLGLVPGVNEFYA